MYTQIEVQPNANTPISANQVYKNLSEPVRLLRVRLYEGEPEGRLCDITGWSSAAGGSAVAALAVRVEDSSSGEAILVYGGDWGVRLRPAGSHEAWDVTKPEQWGETHLVLSDEEDIYTAEDC